VAYGPGWIVCQSTENPNDPTPVPRHQWLGRRRSGIMRWMSDLAETELKSPDWNPSRLALYFALACGFSLVLWLPILLEKSFPFLFSIGTFGPTLAAFATHWIFARNWRAVRLWTTWCCAIMASGMPTTLSPCNQLHK
jgi:hypothetical protein